MPDDVLQHDDGVVDHEPHRKRQRHQRKVVQGEAQEYMPAKVPMIDMGSARLGMGGGDVAQEEEDHEDHQIPAIKSVNFTSLTATDRYGAIIKDLKVDRGRELGLKMRKQLLDGVHHLHGVRPRLALDGEDDGAIIVVPARDLVVFDAVDDLAKFLKRTGEPLR